MTKRYDNLRSQCLVQAMELITGDRFDEYGEPIENFTNIAAGWSVLLGQEISPAQVSLCMAWLKMARLVQSPDHSDSYHDGAAYVALAYELQNVDPDFDKM